MTAQDFQPTPIGLQCTSGDDNRRVAPRRKVLKAGTIEFADTAIPCTVRSLSATGAANEINTPLWFPDRFVLAVRSRDTSNELLTRKLYERGAEHVVEVADR